MMKKTAFLFLLSLLPFSQISAQEIELTALGGYTFGDKLPVSAGTARFNGGSTYGAMLNYLFSENTGLNILYTQEITYLELRSILLVNNNERIFIDGDIHFITLGLSHRLPINDRFAASGSANIGMAVLSADDSEISYNSNSEYMFAAGLNGWLDIYLTDRIGLKAMANLQVPIQFAGAGIYLGSGGASVGVNGYSNILNFSFMGGITLRLGE